mgnify:CR=1 FL=1
MKIDYDKLTLSDYQRARYIRTIEHNPFIPKNNLLKTKLYREQILANTYEVRDEEGNLKPTRKLIGGSAYSGKSRYGASSALQDFEALNYRCLVVRRTYDDVIATGGIVDYIDKFLNPYYKENGGFVVHNESKKVFHNTKTDAKIFYSYMMYLKDRKKFKSRAYHKIIVDEASELLKENLQYLNRSLRDPGNPNIPLVLEYISNPDSSSGIEYLNEIFVKPEGPHPYFEMNFWNNPFVNAKEYFETLQELSKADFQYQMGNWNYQLGSGDIFDRDMIIAATIPYELYERFSEANDLIRNVMTVDIAASEKKSSNYTACTRFEGYRGGVNFALQQQSFKALPGKLENRLHNIFSQNHDEGVQTFIEYQPAAAGKIMARYWNKEFKKYGVKFIPVFKNKIIRAGKVVPLLKNAGLPQPNPKKHRLYFVEDQQHKWIEKFTRQAVNFPSELSSDVTDGDPESFNDDRVDNMSLYAQIIKSKPKKIRVSG